MKNTFLQGRLAAAVVSVSFITLLSSCDIGDPSKIVSDPFPLPNIPTVAYKANLHRINTYPVTARVILDTYSSYTNTTFSHIHSSTFIVPASDTSITFNDGFAGQYYYFTYRIISANNDSLSDGKTPVITLNN